MPHVAVAIPPWHEANLAMRPSDRRATASFVAFTLVLAGMVAGCTSSREVSLDLRWDLTSTGACDTAGEGMGEKEITFRHVKSPAYFETVCSNRIANHLLANGKNPVPAKFLYYPRTQGHSLCEIDGIKATRVGGPAGQSCTELGHRMSGTQSSGSAPAGPPPFGAP